MSFLYSLTNFHVLIAIVVIQHLLGFSRPLSLALQSVDCDLVEAHRDARNLLIIYKQKRTDASFHSLFLRAESIAKSIGIGPSKPRISNKQKHRSNAPSDTVEEYYCRNLFFPFLDHIITSIDTRFSVELLPVLQGQYLIPSNVSNLNPNIIENICSEFMTEFPDQANFSQELERWIIFCESLEEKPKTLQGSLNLVKTNLFPNVRAVLSLLLTLPVGSVTCERSFSALRRLKTWLRSSMTEERLNGLALLHIHQGETISQMCLENILQRFNNSRLRIGQLFV